MTMNRWNVELRFNSRLQGYGQVWTGEVEAGGIEEAVTAATSAAVRLPEHGQSIYVTGAVVAAAGTDLRSFTRRGIGFAGRTYDAVVKVDDWQCLKALVARAAKSTGKSASALGRGVVVNLIEKRR
jgi:hypothetical protein